MVQKPGNALDDAHIHASLSAEEIAFIQSIKNGYLAKQFIDNDFCERLPIEKGYVRLAMVEEEGQRRKEKQQLSQRPIADDKATLNESNQAFMDKRLSSFEDIYGTKTPIEPKDIFKKSHSAAKPVRRALILGRAGIGKSTLCHYVAYQWAKEALWKNVFVLVLWIPLRRLLHYPADKVNLFDVILNECILKNKFGKKPFTSLEIEQLLSNIDRLGQILYVLDGFDEVKHLAIEAPGKETSQGELIRLLLNQEDVIITSRPYYIDSYLHSEHSKGIDQRLENIGFLDNDVGTYIQHFFAKPALSDIGKRLITFLNQNRSIKGIAHIPINLSLICRAWKKHHDKLSAHLTMTDLYIWLLTDLGIRYLIHQRHEYIPTQSTPSTILQHPHCQSILAFLAELAFEQMQKSDLIILPETLHAISKKYPDDNVLDKALQFGLLKALDNDNFEDRKSYYFVHLTFQEFLAARYIAEKLKRNDAAIKEFIKRHKYYPEYEIAWWFVSGLLNENVRELEQFFDVLEETPSDLVGITHQLLILRCLDEGKLNLELKRKEKLLVSLIEWIRIEVHYRYSYKIHLLADYLSLCPVIFEQPQIHECFITLLIDPDADVKSAAAEALGEQSVLPEAAHANLILLLQNPDWRARSAAAYALGKRSTLPEAMQVKLVLLLQDSNEKVRLAAAKALGRQSVLPEAAQAKLVLLLQDSNKKVGWAAAGVLGEQSVLPEAVQAKLVLLLQDPDAKVRRAAAWALGQQSALSEAAQAKLAPLLQDPDEEVRSAAAYALGKRSTLSEAVQVKLVLLLQDPNAWVRNAAAKALERQSVLPEAVQAKLVLLLQDSNKKVRRAAAWALGQQSALPEAAQAKLVLLLQDPDAKVRRAAAEALGQQSALPETVPAKLVLLLQDSDAKVRKAAAYALERQSALPEAAQAKLAPLLQDPDEEVRSAAAYALGRQSALPEAVQAKLVSLLQDPGEKVRRAAAWVLEKQSALSEAVQAQIVALLQDPGAVARREAVQALEGQSVLPEAMQAKLVLLLQDPDEEVRRAAAEALRKQSALSKNTIQQLGSLISSNSQTRAVSALRMFSYRQVLKFINFNQSCEEWLSLLKVLLLKSLQQKIPIYFSGSQLYIEKTPCGDFTDEQKRAFINATQRILNELIPNFSDMVQFHPTTHTQTQTSLFILKPLSYGEKTMQLQVITAQELARQKQMPQFLQQEMLILDVNQHEGDFKRVLQSLLACDRRQLNTLITKNEKLVLRKDKHGNTVLHYAAYVGDAGCLAILLEANGSINLRNQFGLQPLHVASFFGRDKATTFLMERGAPRESVAIHLPQWEAPVQCTVLHLVILSGHIDLAMALLNSGKDTSFAVGGLGNLLHLAVFSRDPFMLKAIARHPVVMANPKLYNETAVVGGTKPNQKPNQEDLTPLALATFIGNVSAVRILTFHPLVHLNFKSHHKSRTALHTAAKYKRLGEAKVILGSVGDNTAALELVNLPDGTRHKKTPYQVAKKREEALEKAKQTDEASDYTLVANCLSNNAFNLWENLRKKPLYTKPRIRNLVFQGGGPKGIAYIGALAALDQQLNQGDWSLDAIERVAGTSAGAITALLVALRLPIDTMREELNTLDMASLMDGVEVEKLKKILEEVKAVTQSGQMGAGSAANMALEIVKQTAGLNNHVSAGIYLWQHREEIWEKLKAFTGLCSGDAFVEWLRGVIQRRLEKDGVVRKYGEAWAKHFTFKKLAMLVNDNKFNYKHLYVVACCITGEQHLEIMNSEDGQWDEVEIVEAVRASMSIPGVYKPQRIKFIQDGNEVVKQYVDGGILMNFPIKLFDKVKYLSRYLHGDPNYEVFNEETLGFRLINKQQSAIDLRKVESAASFIKQMMGAFYEAEKIIAEAENKYQYRCLAIDDCGFGTLDFDINQAGKEKLELSGSKTVEDFFTSYSQLSATQPAQVAPANLAAGDATHPQKENPPGLKK